MFHLSASKLESLLASQTNQFMAYIGAGDFNYQTRDITNVHYRERRSVAEKSELRQCKTFSTQTNVPQTSARREHFNVGAISPPQQKTANDLFDSCKLSNITGPQWTTWRKQRSVARIYRRRTRLPPSPSEPEAELYMDIHEERMEGLSYMFEVAPMSTSS
ncbi:uncharacterized protein LOC132732516 [Ruditapes philippinarum]|uniref:uncharacterized protein LOC132732516 n=1 Tax=Ruditapes philippinarum TaxID=129788 RepID=UPI00295B3C34|nr:uncharacterized protein LOC132732516 [Ruditapes philippinarum]